MTGNARKLRLIKGSSSGQAGSPNPPQKAPASIFEFGPFRLDLRRHELRREGHRVRLAPAPMELLRLFVERRDVLVSREDIVNRLWSAPGMVDVDQGINTAIRRIRQVLRDDPAKPRYIETVVGKGYRFVCEVKVIDPADADASPQEENDDEEVDPEDEETSPAEVLEFEPPGQANKAASRMRALKWIGVPIVLALLAGLGIWGWRHVHRPLSYTATLSQVTTNDTEKRVTASAISPDGKWIAYSDVQGSYLRLMQNGRTVTLNGPDSFRAERLAWFPDQTKLLLSGFDPKFANLEIWIVSITGDPPRLFRKDAHSGIPSPDGRKIAFLSANDQEIWVAGADGEAAHRLVSDPQGRILSKLFWAGSARRISYLRNSGQLWINHYESVDAETGEVLAQENLGFAEAVALPDGRMFMLRDEDSYRIENFSLWEVQTDLATGAFRSAPTVIAEAPKARVSALTATDDGRHISFVAAQGAPHIYVAKLKFPGPVLEDVKRLTHSTRADFPHGWLQDNETVLFESDRVDAYRLYAQRLQDQDAREYNTGASAAILPQATPDGTWILYAMNPDIYMSPTSRLFRIPIGGGTPEEVSIGGPLQEFRCPLRRGSCVLMEIADQKYIHYYALDPLSGKGRALGQTAWTPHVLSDWDVAPDGSAVALAIHDYANPRIRVVPLENQGQERELEIRSRSMPSGVNWAADGQGWYVSTDTGTGKLLLYVNRQGESHILLHSPSSTWGVPSPDGTKLAFMDQTVDSNVWVWDLSRHR